MNRKHILLLLMLILSVCCRSTNPAHYRSLIPSEARDNSTMALTMANEVTDIAVTGSGLIDGNGRGTPHHHP